MTAFRKTAVLFSLLALLSFWHCEKENSEGDISGARYISAVNLVITDALLNAQEGLGMIEDTLEGKVKGHGMIDFYKDAQLSSMPWDTLWPKLITIDYVNPVILKDGRSRSGMIDIQTNGYWQDSSLSASVILLNYNLKDYNTLGTINLSRVINDDHVTFKVTTKDLKVIQAGDTLLCTFSGEYAWEKGNNSDYPSTHDDHYLLAGSGLISSRGSEYTYEIIQPLRRAFDCPWLKAGAAEFSSADAEIKVLNYGRGDCDATASSINGDDEIFFLLD